MKSIVNFQLKRTFRWVFFPLRSSIGWNTYKINNIFPPDIVVHARR